MNIKVRKNKDTDENYLALNDFKDIVNIDKVKYYKLTEKDGVLLLSFYDKNKKLLKTKDKKS